MSQFRSEHDSMGSVKVPADALYGAQTQRALDNFHISDLRMPPAFIDALAHIKAAAASTNAEIGELGTEKAAAIRAACDTLLKESLYHHFPVDVFQTGSGTSSNMNINEVISHLVAREQQLSVHPNDDVNMSQSSNDVIPSAIHVSAFLQLQRELLPALRHLSATCRRKAADLSDIVKTGRTHLMDAVPLTLGQEIMAWSSQIESATLRLEQLQSALLQLPQGGTAIGTGINAPEGFSRRFCTHLSHRTGVRFVPAANPFAAQASQDTALALSGELKACATALMKIANDLRWMNSGPLAGLGEIALPALQPGSSIMPGKVNPVICEATLMVAAQVCGNDTAITICAQHGNFQLNTMLPLIAYNLLQSESLLASASTALADQAIAGFSVNQAAIEARLARNPILVTALNPFIGYERAAAIAKEAYRSQRPILEVAAEMTDLDPQQLAELLNPARLTGRN